MTATVKGIWKGLRNFTQIFDQKEPEMQIGLPTDVKHVAHIGWDGPSSSANTPGWMTGFKSVPELVNQPSNSHKESKNPAKNLQVAAGTRASESRNSTKHKNKSARKSVTGSDSPLDCSNRRSASDEPKQSRRSSSSNTSMDSPRGHSKSNLGVDESPLHDASGVPKPSRRKKLKGGEGSTRSSKSKGQNPSPEAFSDGGCKSDTGQELKNQERHLSS